MSEKLINELQSQGFVLLKKFHLLLVVGAFLLGGIAQVVLAFNSIKDHEERITHLEERNSAKHDMLLELQANIRKLMESQGLEYTELTTK